MANTSRASPVSLVYLVCLVCLVEPDRPNRPDKPNEQARLADFFSILLVSLLGTVKADDKLGRTMVGFAPAAGAGDFGFPVRGFVVESAEYFSALEDGRPGFVRFGDIRHEAAYGDGDVTALRSLSLCHTETTRLFCRGV